VSANGKQLLAKAGGAWMLTTSLGKDEKRLDLDRVRVRVEPELEWKQILREVWRIQRDYFYDPQMHGVDWKAMWERWSPFLAHVHHRADLNLVIGDLIGELATGHEYVAGATSPPARRCPGRGSSGPTSPWRAGASGWRRSIAGRTGTRACVRRSPSPVWTRRSATG